jgi:peptidoglycan/LPS O-acetylase OafA/YrhL
MWCGDGSTNSTVCGASLLLPSCFSIWRRELLLSIRPRGQFCLLSDWRAVIAAIVAALGISFAVAAYASLRGSHLPTNVPLNLALMFLGTLMRRAWLEQDMGAKRWVVPISLVWAALMPPILWLTPSQPDMPITPLSFCLAYWLALSLFIAAAKLNVPKGNLFIWLGVVSYLLYLFHDICIEVMLKLIPRCRRLA